MSELEIFFGGRGGGNPDNVLDTLTWTMSQLEFFFWKGGGVTQTMSLIP